MSTENKTAEAIGKLLGLLLGWLISVACIRWIWNSTGVELFGVKELSWVNAFLVYTFFTCIRTNVFVTNQRES